MPKVQETILEIDLKALKHNLSYLRSALKPTTKFMAVVKAFAYGSDAVEIAKYLQEQAVDYLAVAFTNEGVALRNAGVTLPILVLHPQPVNFEELIDRCLEPNLYNARVLRAFLEVAKKKSQQEYPVHIKFNTGLNRLGFWENDVDFIVNALNKAPEVKVASVFSHLAASEDANEKDFTLQQIKSFTKIAEEFTSKIGYKPLYHQLNTSGIIYYPEAQFDMVRSGIGLYGFGNGKDLQPIASLKTVISQIHKIEPGESVGYNRAFTTSTYMKIATLPIGHADGVTRIYGNQKGFVYINNQKAAILGNVCMDMLMVDVTDINCNEGDEVVVFDKKYSAETLAEAAGTISYELITDVSQRIKRVFLR